MIYIKVFQMQKKVFIKATKMIINTKNLEGNRYLTNFNE